jgi:hypothetical protein
MPSILLLLLVVCVLSEGSSRIKMELKTIFRTSIQIVQSLLLLVCVLSEGSSRIKMELKTIFITSIQILQSFCVITRVIKL